MNDRTEIGQCVHQFRVDGRLAGVDNRSDRRTMLGEEILTPRTGRQHQSVVLRGQGRSERRRNATYLQNGRGHQTIVAEAAVAVTSSSNNSDTPNVWRRTPRRSGSDVPPLARITVAPATRDPGSRSWAAEGGEAVTNIVLDLAVGLEIPMLDHRTPTHFEVQHRSLVLRCQALSGERHVLELLAIEIPALEVRIVAGVDHHRNIADPARGVQTSIAQSASYMDRAVAARCSSAEHRAAEHHACDNSGPAGAAHQPRHTHVPISTRPAANCRRLRILRPATAVRISRVFRSWRGWRGWLGWRGCRGAGGAGRRRGCLAALVD